MITFYPIPPSLHGNTNILAEVSSIYVYLICVFKIISRSIYKMFNFFFKFQGSLFTLGLPRHSSCNSTAIIHPLSPLYFLCTLPHNFSLDSGVGLISRTPLLRLDLVMEVTCRRPFPEPLTRHYIPVSPGNDHRLPA